MALHCVRCGGVIPDLGTKPFSGCESHIKPEINFSLTPGTLPARDN